MHVEIKPLGELRKVMKRNSQIDLKEGANVYDLIKTIDARYGTKVWETSINPDTMDLQENATIFVNSLPARGKLSAQLKDGDVIIIIPSIGCC